MGLLIIAGGGLLLSQEHIKGSLHTTIFSKYTELLQLKNIFRIFWNYFWNILVINVFQSKNVKGAVFKKMAGIDNSKLIRLIIISLDGLLLSQKHI